MVDREVEQGLLAAGFYGPGLTVVCYFYHILVTQVHLTAKEAGKSSLPMS